MTGILVVEDEQHLQEEIADWLELEGYQTHVACNGREGLKVALEAKPDLIISDISMPHMDGFNFLLEVRANPQLTSVPFIFVTASAEYESIRKGMVLGADDYLIKPFDQIDLLKAITTRLERRLAFDAMIARQISSLNEVLAQKDQQQKLQLNISAMLSHDLRSLMTVVLSSSDLLKRYRERMDDRQQMRHLDRIQGASYQIVHMLDDLLLSAEMETGVLAFEPEMLDVCALIGKLVMEFQIICDETHSIDYQCDVDGSAYIDRRLFRQIMTNLLSNSVKYSPDGGQISVRLEAEGDHIVLKIADKGIGISSDDLPHLFDPFFRADNAKKIGGTGLGLPIVKRAAELHGGTVQVISELGHGSCFMIYIPRAIPEQS